MDISKLRLRRISEWLSPDFYGTGLREKIIISLFHAKQYKKSQRLAKNHFYALRFTSRPLREKNHRTAISRKAIIRNCKVHKELLLCLTFYFNLV